MNNILFKNMTNKHQNLTPLPVSEQSIASLPQGEPKIKSMRQILNKTGFNLPQVDSILTGKIISVSRKSVIVDLGALGTGIIYPVHFYTNLEMQKKLKPGTEVKALLLELENEEGLRELSLREAQFSSSWAQIKDLFDKKEIITVKISNLNKGGLITEIAGIQAFMPLSQLAPEHYPKVENGDTTKIVQYLQKLRNEEMQIMIIDFNEVENKLIVSELAAYQATASKEISKFQVEETVDAEVTEVTDFGVFVKIKKENEAAAPIAAESQEDVSTETSKTETSKPTVRMIDGLIHKSELSWGMVVYPSDIVKVGEKIKAKIMSIEGNRISLSLKALKPNPWEKLNSKYRVGEKVKGKVIKTDNFGAYVEIKKDIIGVVPISEFSGKKPSEILELGKKYDFAIINFSPKEQKLLLTPEKTFTITE